MTRDEEILEAVIDIVRSELRKYEPLSCVGEVTAVNPLHVKVGSYEIDEDFMVIDSSCRKTVIKIPTDSANQHTHGMDEALVDYTATGNSGAPIIFSPLGVEALVPSGNEPDFNAYPNTGYSDLEEGTKGTGANPYYKVNPDIPNPTTLPLKHSHGIHDALPQILVHRGLKVGDKVNVLRVGSIHFIQGRAGVSTNDGSLDDDGKEQL